MDAPRVSVLMPAYNAVPYVRHAVASVLAQTYPDFELIVVDDGSADGTADSCLEAFGCDPRCRVISRPNTGIVGALNEGFTAAEGTDYIARMDADDLAEPDRFRQQVEYLDTNPDCVAVGCRALAIDPDENPIGLLDNPPSHDEIEALLFRGQGGAIPHPGVMVRKAALARVNGYDPRYQLAEDLDLFLRLGEIGRLANLPEVLLRYRLHLGSTNVVQRANQLQVIARVLKEANGRRKLPIARPLPSEVPLTPLEVRAMWAYKAVAAGHYRTSLRHVAACLTRRPWKLAWWRLLGATMKGFAKNLVRPPRHSDLGSNRQ
jgi:glycosyltransferase involved in cell wall biosynthesis